MSRLRAVAAALSLGMPFVATAADVTRVASSFEENDPFGLFIDAGIEHTIRRTHILRELATPETVEGRAPRELRSAFNYSQYETRLNVDVAAGISQDVEFSFGLPFILFRNEYGDYAEGVTAGAPILANLPARATGTENGYRAYRLGLGNARFGLAWAIFNQKKDDTKPTWVARFHYEAPTAARLDPSVDTYSDGTSRTPVGDRVHKYTLSTALSRQIGLAEPYFKASWTIPVRGPGAYSNCDNPGLLDAGSRGNCGPTGLAAGWTRAATGLQAPHVVGVVVGSEFQIIDNPVRNIRLDVRALGNFVGAGRYYNELSGALGKMLTTSEYLQVGGQAGLTVRVSGFLAIRGTAMFLYNTDHALTGEKPEEDPTGGTTLSANPSHDPRWDAAGTRFFASESKDFRFDATALFTF
ncbi:hypothetical protein [Melittangium boletus]|uniref:hypothetical protein n=1 Tax=Melittangium boletus TaxID=83453 RepID=UPI003DA6526B